MDGRATTAETKYSYEPNSWQRASSGSSTPRTDSTSPTEPSLSFFATPLLLPILFPTQSSLYRDKLLQYNKLVSPGRGGGGGLQAPAPSVPSTSSSSPSYTPPATRSRSSSKVSNKENLRARPGRQSCHGNRATKPTDIAERAPITAEKGSLPKMSGKKHSDQPAMHSLSVRPPLPANQSASLPSAHSNSVPSTPHQHARKFSFESREPSPGATQNHSPRSAYSETNGNVPSLRSLPARVLGCRFETAVPHSRRRMPYSLGTERLGRIEPEKITSKLTEDDERKLTTDLRELYDRLLPTKEVESNRQKLVQKLEKLFNDEWPGRDIRVQMFGSSGNLLCSDDSDVDICITTPWKGLEEVCMIAELLDRHGMDKVVCVKSAKVPIVKIWDPELGLACDMNVNNTPALENTRMVRTYVEIDERVRPLAMTIKYWTRRRIVNDAALGGTLSSYTWICMIIAFLQLRDPPVLPALHQRHNHRLPRNDGSRSAFADDVDKLRGFGAKNTDSLGALLFQFFRFYAHEFDYDKYILSVRLGKLMPKTERGWHIGSNNMLCVEEPFTTVRNLGNTADDTSFRGLHMEMRRAFDLIAEGKLNECCEEYIFPKEEERIFQKPMSAPRPILVRSSSQQQHSNRGRGGYRGSRQNYRNGNSSRRASSSVPYDTNAPLAQAGPSVSTQEPLWYQTQTPSNFLESMTLEAMAAQETKLRLQLQLYTQAQQMNHQQVLAHAQRMQGGSSHTSDRSRTNSLDNLPLTVPIRPDLMYAFPSPIQQQAAYYHPGFTTYPSSPSTGAATAGGASEFRRSPHRNTVTGETGGLAGGVGTLRSQSQPASRTATMPASQSKSGYAESGQIQGGASVFQQRHMKGVPVPSFVADEVADAEFDDAPVKSLSESSTEDEVPRYIGYYVNESSSPVGKANGFPGAVPSFGDLVESSQGRRRLSTDQMPQSILDRRMKRTSRSPSPLGHARAFSVGTNSAPLASAPFQPSSSRLGPNRAPLVVNGSVAKSASLASGSSRLQGGSDVTASDDTAFDNLLYISHGGSGLKSTWTEPLAPHTAANSAEPSPMHHLPERPLVVNGSSIARSPVATQSAPDAPSQRRAAAGAALHGGIVYASATGDANGMAGFSSPTFARPRTISRQQQNGIAPLDLATSVAMGDFAVVHDLQHLSPVYENRTPSPSAVRKFEAPAVVTSSKMGPAKDTRGDGSSKPTQRTPPMKATPTGPAARLDNHANHFPPLDPRVNGIARENGHVRGAKSQSDKSAGWQTAAAKIRRKGVADLKQATNSFAQNDQFVKNDSDRKGG
ncbi:Poly(A) RNA polymerase cid13 [Diplogelasinospora grovesii]|uniref:polynucleotide adenylyltransferase n=1 Tax=Diplogelasinospora grovesii TaxID=303347 RepID=A0AAN6N870_9PEZI|nr:Poly(A) RNA polymerase cid13 [Diplogelasinospora grovesii]